MRDCLPPMFDLYIWLRGEGFGGNVFRKEATLWFRYIVEADRFLQERHMLCRIQLQLYCLPSKVAKRLQARYRGCLVWVRSRLQRVGASHRLVHEGQPITAPAAEDLVIVAATGFVESSKARRCQFSVCAWFELALGICVISITSCCRSEASLQ